MISTLLHRDHLSLQSTATGNTLAPFQLESVAGTFEIALCAFCAAGHAAVALYAPLLAGWTIWVYAY